MSIDKSEVKKIAVLARIQIDEKDIPGYAKDLTDILGLVEQINKIDTDAISPMAHPLNQSQRLREDEITEFDQHEMIQVIAPQVEADLYLVPKVIE